MKKLNQHGKVTQPILIAVVVIVTLIVVAAFLFYDKDDQKAKAVAAPENEGTEASGEEAEHGHEGGEEEALSLTAKQMTEQGIQIAQVAQGEVQQVSNFPAKLVTNSDQQAHIASMFAGRVESVQANLGDQVKKGQALARVVSPELANQQSEIQLARSNLELAKQEYDREQKLWSQGISAKQDFQRANHAYRQAQISLQAAQSRLSALGVAKDSSGRYVITSPISGVVTTKDIVVGEYVQMADQLFVIDQLGQLWLEFVLPAQQGLNVVPNQEIEFISLQTNGKFKARIQTLGSVADEQTGRLQVRAVVLSDSSELRPNLQVSIQLPSKPLDNALRVQRSAVQTIEGKPTVFLIKQLKDKIEFEPQVVELGGISADQQWIEITKGIKLGQKYVSQGSFILKSELEKGEASHAH